MSSNCELIHST